MARVFLSYDHDDFALAKPLAAALETAGHTVWYDRHIHGGAQFTQKIEQALDDADAVLVMWSANSLDSAWVRDEAAEGRDRNKLVPLSIGSVTPPMGFRQYQTIDLGEWKGRGRVPRIDQILDAIESQTERGDGDVPPARPARHAPPPPSERPRWLVPVAIAAILVLALGFGAWKFWGKSGMPVVEVAAANASPQSQAAATDLFVKLGSLAQIAEGKWQLVDQSAAPGDSAFVFRAADSGTAENPQASLVLLDGNGGSLLWSREFAAQGRSAADVRQQLALTAGRVLRCALDGRDYGNLRRDILKLYLNACSLLAEGGYEEAARGAELMRQVVTADPEFTAAWGPLIVADQTALQVADTQDSANVDALKRNLTADVLKAKSIVPDLPELAFVRLRELPPTAYADSIGILENSVAKAPETSDFASELAGEYQRVGRMADGVNAARQAAELDPLSPDAHRQFILALAYAGQMTEARDELAKAEKSLAGTGALRDVLWAFHVRFGDPDIALKYAKFPDSPILKQFIQARREGSPASIEKLIDMTRSTVTPQRADNVGQAIQTYGEFDKVDDIVELLDKATSDDIASISYILFRPQLSVLRNDPRFMRIASRIGLVRYWRSSGKWPDSCSDPALPYNCKAEAAKYAG